MASNFEAQLSLLPPSSAKPGLPLVHLTDWAKFLAISSDDAFISMAPCPVFGENLVFTFYGRPSYRAKQSELSFHIHSYSPVCFLLKPDTINLSKRIMPFDSGGFKKYGPAMHPSFTCETFELNANAKSASNVVGSFWGSNREYFSRKPKSGLSISGSSLALLHYYLLITNQLTESFDERSSTIEVQFTSPLKLSGNVMALIVPSGVADNDVKEIAKKLNADIVNYDFEMPFYLNDYFISIRKVVREYLESRKLL